MNDLMFEVPGDKSVTSIVIDKDVIENNKKPIINHKPKAKKKSC